MTNSPLERARRVFLDCLKQQTPERRAEIIDRECGDDDTLRSAVVRLVDAHETNGSFLDVPLGELLAREDNSELCDTLAVSPDDGPSVSQIGPYKLVRPIGEGGFGIVYLAEQTAPVRRQVALKIVKAGMDTKEVIARFEAERQALALIPNYALRRD